MTDDDKATNDEKPWMSKTTNVKKTKLTENHKWIKTTNSDKLWMMKKHKWRETSNEYKYKQRKATNNDEKTQIAKDNDDGK